MELSTDRFAQYLLKLSEHLQSSTVVHELCPVFQQRYLREVNFTAPSTQPFVPEMILQLSGRALLVCASYEITSCSFTLTASSTALPVRGGLSGTPVTSE